MREERLQDELFELAKATPPKEFLRALLKAATSAHLTWEARGDSGYEAIAEDLTETLDAWEEADFETGAATEELT
jgi:hypothetical protein